MNIELFTSASIRDLVNLVERREKLVDQLKTLEAEIVSRLGGVPARRAARKGRPPKKVSGAGAGRRGRRGGQKPGALKERILGVLENAGDSGITVADIASKLSVPKANVHVWFSTTGKRLSEVKKMEPGRFRFKKK